MHMACLSYNMYSVLYPSCPHLPAMHNTPALLTGSLWTVPPLGLVVATPGYQPPEGLLLLNLDRVNFHNQPTAH